MFSLTLKKVIMKKLLLILSAVFIFSVSHAQVIVTGDQAINLGIGVGGTMVSEGGLPSINFSYETLPLEKLGIGYIGIGGYLAYKHSRYYTYTYENGTYVGRSDSKNKCNYYVFGGRATYHFDFYDMNHNNFFNYFDVYAGVFLGFSYDVFKYENADTKRELCLRHDLFVGCRYMFSDSFGAFAEAGYGINYLSTGITYVF